MKDNKDIQKQIETDKDMIIFQVIGYIFFYNSRPRELSK